MSNVIVFLDFDGVLSDSVKEAYILSRYAFYNISPFCEIDVQIFQKFKQFRVNVTDSWQYYNFFAKKKETFNSITMEFNKNFLLKRKELMLNHQNFWLELETKMDFVDKIKPFIISHPESFRILSTKNREAISEKLFNWGLNLSPDCIYDKNDLVNVSKGQFINEFLNDNKEYTSAILIDDNEKNIESCYPFNNIDAILTSWGYIHDLTKGKTEDVIIERIKEIL